MFLVAFSLAYLIVYSFSFFPNGYQIVEQQQASLYIQKNNLVGLESETIHYNSTEKDFWKIDYLADHINDQKLELLLFFTALFGSIFLFLSLLAKEDKFISALFRSGIFAALLTVFPYINTLSRIDSFLSSGTIIV